MEVDEARTFVPDLSEDDLYASWHLIEADGTRLTGRDAAMALLQHLRVTRSLAATIQRLSLEGVVGHINHFAKEHRGTLSRFVPDVDPPHRPPPS